MNLLLFPVWLLGFIVWVLLRECVARPLRWLVGPT